MTGLAIEIHDYLWYNELFIVSWIPGTRKQHKVEAETMAQVLNDSEIEYDHDEAYRLVGSTVKVPSWFKEPPAPLHLVQNGLDIEAVYAMGGEGK